MLRHKLCLQTEAERRFDAWNSDGKVLSWEISKTYYDVAKDTFMATWEFRFQYPETQGLDSCFAGITVMKIQDGKIIRLHEYSMKHKLYRPYQND